MTGIPTYAVVPTKGRDCLEECVETLLPQVDRLFLVWTGKDGVPLRRIGSAPVVVIEDSGPVNISRWWNRGIGAARDAARDACAPQWNTLVANDDVVVPPGAVAALGAGLRSTWDAEPALAYPDQEGGGWHLAVSPADPARIAGYFFMLRGETGITVDERLAWWYSDNGVDLAARSRGGSLRVPGCRVEHLHPSGYTVASAELTAQAHRDRVEYERISREEGF